MISVKLFFIIFLIIPLTWWVSSIIHYVNSFFRTQDFLISIKNIQTKQKVSINAFYHKKLNIKKIRYGIKLTHLQDILTPPLCIR